MSSTVSEETRAFDPRQTRAALTQVTDGLIREFGWLPPGTVIRHTARARMELRRTGVRQGLATATEAMVRTRLRALTASR